MESTILLDIVFNEALSRLDPKYLGEIKPTEYEIFRSINIYTLDDYYKLYSFRPNELNLSKALANKFEDTIAAAVRLLKKEYYPKDRILYIYGLITYYTIINSNLDLAKLENSLIEAKGLNKREKALSYTKGYYKIDLVDIEFLDILIREIVKYPGAMDYYKNANYHKFYLLNTYKGSKSKFKAFNLKIINKIFKHSFKEEKEGLPDFITFYPSLLNKIVKLLNAFNDYLYFDKEKQFKESLAECIKKED